MGRCADGSVSRATYVIAIQQLLDGVGSGCGCAQALLLHGVGQILVVDVLASVFHELQQTGLLESVFGLAEFFREVVFFQCCLARVVWKAAPAFRNFVFLRNDGSPAFDLEGFDVLDKSMAGFGRRPLGHVPLSCGVPRRKEIPHNQIVELCVVSTKVPGRCLPGGDDGVVIGDFRVVEVSF